MDRTNQDLDILMEFTQKLEAFNQMTEAVRRALCSVMVFAVVEKAGKYKFAQYLLNIYSNLLTLVQLGKIYFSFMANVGKHSCSSSRYILGTL